jgi:hypothetical protein
MRKLLFICTLIAITVLACKKDFEGEANGQSAPETYAVVDSVRRDSNNLLTTTVTGHWWGESKSGFIKGYWVSVDNKQTWQFTKEQQGTYLLNLPVGFEKGDLPIYVQAEDNRGQKDPTPAMMVFPVKNTAPTIVADIANPVPATSFPIIKINWLVSDIDGQQDLSQYEIVLNDTTQAPMTISAQVKDLVVDNFTVANSIRIEAQIAGGVFQPLCNVFTTNKTTPLPGTLSGLKFDSLNVIYVRALDRTASKSKWIGFSVTVKRPKSDVIMVNCLTSSINSTQNQYLTLLGGPTVNITQVEVVRGINNSVGQAEVYSDALTQQRTFALFRKMIWLTDDANTLATAQLTTINFFNNGGKMFIQSQFGDAFPDESPVLSFTPIQSLINPLSNPMFTSGSFRIDNTCEASAPGRTGWPVVKYSNTAPVQSVRPFKTYTVPTGVFGYDSLMTSVLKVQTNNQGSPYWVGPSVVMSKRFRVANNETDMVITSLPMHLMNANNNIDSLFHKVFIDELKF